MPNVMVTQAGAVLEVRLNRPEKKNALTPGDVPGGETRSPAPTGSGHPRRAADRRRRHLHQRQRHHGFPGTGGDAE